ncbi:MAG: protease complex subunit PrcB family protein [Thermodesulfobacteriota bacterium]
MTRKVQVSVLIIATIFIFSCKHPVKSTEERQSLSASVLYTATTCGRAEKESKLTWINNSDDFKRVYGGLLKQSFGLKENPRPKIDFKKNGVLLIEMGSRPTAGYAVESSNKGVRVIGSLVEVNTHWIKPAPGAILAQIITSPCLMISFTASEYSIIRVIDQKGDIKAETGIK